MCGIIGVIGKEDPAHVLLDGLKNLEYRGYDSAGLALKNYYQIQVIKSVGKISNLEEKVSDTSLIPASLGIAHTRWATHGSPSEVNAHPHTSGKVTLVHNGIIENAKELKERLVQEGVSFVSDTDTEVAAALINFYYEKDAIQAIDLALNDIVGSYAFLILFADSNQLYALRKDSPLVVGVSDHGNFVASDITAIASWTRQYFLLDEGEIAVLSDSRVDVFRDGKTVEKNILTLDQNDGDSSKGQYEHYMLKEIMEEPMVIEKTLNSILDHLDTFSDLTQYKQIHIVACGSAMYAGMIGKSLLEEYASFPVICEVASEYRYKNVLYDRKTLVILISQSGETADTIAAMRKAKDASVDTLAIVNVKTSTLARESDRQIFIEAGPEVAVATTKAYILQVFVLALLSYQTAVAKGMVHDSSVLVEARKLPQMISEVLNRRDEYIKIAEKIYSQENIFFIGRKIDYAISLEGSLKLKEVSYIHSEAYQAGELKHGTISLIHEGMPLIAILTQEDILEKTLANLEEAKSRGAMTIVVSNQSIPFYDMEILVPKVNAFLQPILVVPCLQLLAYEVAKMRGCDIDKPRNLAKSVTVE